MVLAECLRNSLGVYHLKISEISSKAPASLSCGRDDLCDERGRTRKMFGLSGRDFHFFGPVAM